MALSRWTRADAKNKYCNMKDLSSETTVEQFFLIRLLTDLGFKDEDIKPKESLDELIIPAGGRKKERYRPDYVCFIKGKPKLVIEAKATTENIDDFTYQPTGYSLALNRRFENENPVTYFIISNGGLTRLSQWDRESPLITLEFTDFVNGNPKFKSLHEFVSHDSLKRIGGRDVLSLTDFLSKPLIDDVKKLFVKCHNLIWRKEKLYPTDAFYEFSKLIFLKLNEDKRIREIMDKGEGLTKDDFRFSVEWIRKEEETGTPNPINAIMFDQLIRNLNVQIEKKKRKQIFATDEEINLKPSTILEVVRLLQNIDLYTIDEDLNGRMFEVFLTAVIRGKELGAFFTPRTLVKFMTNIANLRMYKEKGELVIDKVLDGCCGSGGFLIDAMVDMINKVKGNKSLASEEDEIINEILSNYLYGIEANPKITRIARINMYVHGDGGSRVYCADALDKTVTIEKGEKREFARDLEELRSLLVNKNPLKFDVVLTNPPFAMNYSRKEEFERQILEQYGSTNPDENISYKSETTDLKSSVKSNVLFLARYAELLKEGGKLLIIVDNSLLNGYSDREYREWLKRNFIIKAVISLPQHTFVNAGAGGATSILYLEKRRNPNQVQPHIFARRVDDVGHSKSGKEIPENDLTPDVQKEFELFEKTGKLYLKGEKLIPDFEDDRLFLINPSEIDERLDVEFHMPSYHKLIDKLAEMEKSGSIRLTTIEDYDLLDTINFSDHKDEVYTYVEIANVDKERGTIILDECETDSLDNLPNRARQIIHENDVLFSTPFRSLQKVAVVSKEVDGQLASTGFIGIKCKEDYDEACLVWSILKSDLVQKQFIHISSGYTQRGMSDEYIKKYLKIPIPIKNRDKIVEQVKHQIEIARQARTKELEALDRLNSLYTVT